MLAKTVFASVGSLLALTGQAANLPQNTDHHHHVPHIENQESDEQLSFVFELVRHGARAPIENRDLDKFTVGEGILTPEGMRERYLLGRYNRHRYVDQYAFISDEFMPGEVYMQSTNVNRTMQSGYSELMGLYPPGEGKKLTDLQLDALSDFSAPPFGVRNGAELNKQLGQAALPNAFVQVPITEYNDNNINDDVSTSGCPYINNVGDAREQDTEIWAKYDWMKRETQGPLEEAFEVDQEYVDSLDFHHYQYMTDTAVALDFEGQLDHEDYFTEDAWEANNEYQRVWLTDDYSKDANTLMMSRMLRTPLKAMHSKVAAALSQHESTQVESQDFTDLKYMIYSAHDTQVVNMMDYLTKDFYWTPYASQVIFELKYSRECLASADASEDCFGVAVRFNGNPQLFDGCTGDNFTLNGCKWSEFLSYVEERSAKYQTDEELDEACLQEA